MVIEPESLLRWSITRYLETWFEVIETGTLFGAETRLGAGPLRTVIVSDNLPEEGTVALVGRLRSRDPRLEVILMLSAPPSAHRERGAIHQLEKPFPLAALGALLGVEANRPLNEHSC